MEGMRKVLASKSTGYPRRDSRVLVWGVQLRRSGVPAARASPVQPIIDHVP